MVFSFIGIYSVISNREFTSNHLINYFQFDNIIYIMKKYIKYIFSVVMILAMFIASFCVVNFANYTRALADDENQPTSSIFNYLSITQENYKFSVSDFTTDSINNLPGGAIYTNKTVTISFSEKVSSSRITANTEILNSTTEIDGKAYYVFDIDSLSADTCKIIHILLSAEGVSYELHFSLVQTVNNFKFKNEIYWQYSYHGDTETVVSPSNNQTYSPLSLHIPNASAINPIYIDFEYCGEKFLIYFDGNNYYNGLDNSFIDMTHMKFDLSGTYKVKIYDKTNLYNFDDKNFMEYNFIVKNDTTPIDAFYIIAHLENGDLVVNHQFTNTKTIVNFVNMSDYNIYPLIDRIVVTQYFPNNQEPKTTEYSSSNSTLPNSLSFSEDGTYNIKVLSKNGGAILKEFEFTIIESIRNFFSIDNEIYEPKPTDPSNTTIVYSINRQVPSSYHNIHGTTSYAFIVKIARSNPSIDGVANNNRSSSNVTLTVKGVGNIIVTVTFNGNAVIDNKVYQNYDQLPTFTEAGKYVVRITDEMGTTITKTFTITVKINTAGIILIVVAALMVTLLIVVIFVSRSKVKVR